MSGDFWRPQQQVDWIPSGEVAFLERTTTPMVASYVSVHLFRSFSEFENYGSEWLSANERTAVDKEWHERRMSMFDSINGMAVYRELCNSIQELHSAARV